MPDESRPGRLRILHVLDNLNTGGTELNAVRTAERLDRERFDVRFVCLQPDGPLRARLDAAGIPVRGMPIPSLLSAGAVRRGLELRALVRQEGIDVVHAHDPYANVLAAPWVRTSGRGAVIASHRWWRDVHRPNVRTANRLAYRFAHRVLANSQAVGELVVREEGVPRERLVVIPNFVEEAAFTPLPADRRRELRARYGLGENDIAIGVIANLYPVKDHATLLRAVARIAPAWPALKVVLFGDGGERERLQQIAASGGIADRIIMPGRVAHEAGLAGMFDLGALTSVEEGFPNFVVEAMAAARPVVATRVGGIPDAVLPDETGLLVPSGDDAGLAAAIESLLRDPERRHRMGASGAARARALYHLEAVMPALERLYSGLARRHNS